MFSNMLSLTLKQIDLVTIELLERDIHAFDLSLQPLESCLYFIT